MASQVAACVRAFILTILCANPILKGAWVTLLNSTILSLQEQIAILTLQINRLNILNTLTGIGINTLRALVNKVSTDLNLFLGPLQAFPDCQVLSGLSSTIQAGAIGQKFSAINKKLHDFQRATNLSNILSAKKKKLDQRIADLQAMLDAINTLCP